MKSLVETSFGFFIYMRILLHVLVLAAVSIRLFAQPASDLRVLSEDARSIVVEFHPVFSNAPSADQGNGYTEFRFQGSIIARGEQGSPLVPFRATALHLPSKEYRIQILAADHRELSGIKPAAFPQLFPNKDFGISARNTPVRGEQLSGEFFPREVAQVTNVGKSRGLLLGTLRLYPVQISSARGVARVYSRIVVRIQFTESADQTVPISFLMRPDLSIPGLPASPISLGKTAADSPLAGGEWYRMEVKETGIYKIDQPFLTGAGIALSSIGNINSIRIFGNGGKALPEDLRDPRPDGLEEVARLVVDKNTNGVLDGEDFILFYGMSTRGWNYEPQRKTFSHYINYYTETNQYFLTFGGAGRGKDMATLSSSPLGGTYKPSDYQGKVFLEQELTKDKLPSGREWFGQLFDNANTSAVFTTSLPGVDASKPVEYRIVVMSRSSSIDSFRVQENNLTLGSIPTYPISIGGGPIGAYFYRSPVVSMTRRGDYPSNRSVLRFSFVLRSDAKGWLDWFEIHYRQKFEADNDLLLFTSPDTTALVEYALSKMSSRDVFAFDVSAHAGPRQITNLSFDPADASICRFQVPQAAGSVREFAAVGPKGFKTPSNLKRIANSNLHGTVAGADFIIITPPDFQSEANRLKEHREGRDRLKTAVVNIEQIFNEFSTGMVDPMAIRDFIKYAQVNWIVKPKYILLFGGGNYDYKNIKSTDRNWIPPYESMESIDEINTFASDDFYVLLEPGSERTSLPIGRLPVRSAKEAKDVVDKIIVYETSAPLDPWRNRVTFVADDGLTSVTDDGRIHTEQSETLARTYTPATFQKNKIFIVEYPTVNTSTGRRKPTANQAIVDAINQGTLVLNYTGHGNPDQWAHEKVFSKDEDFSKLRNTGRLFLLVAATCDFARYDYPAENSAGELLLTMPSIGAICVMTADRVVYSGFNAAVNEIFYTNLFKRDPQGLPVRLGDAMWATKQIPVDYYNDLKFHLLADPTLRLAMPRSIVTVDSINDAAAEEVISVPTLANVTVGGAVRRTNGSVWSTLNGRALLEVYDSKRKVNVPEWGDFQFELNGSLLYRGEISVKNGVYRGTFPIPKDVSYDGNRSRVSLYAWSDSSDASGFTENIVVSGSGGSVAADSVGPRIDIRFDDPSFRAGDVIRPDATLLVDLSDDSGINTSTAGIGHRLEATLDGSARTIDLTNFYRGNLDTYRSGQAKYPLTDLPEGRHTIAVKAWDIHNNSSTAESYFEVRSSSQLAIYNVFNYPNPFHRTTTFTFQRTSFDPINVEIKIYTLAGRLVEVIAVPSVSDRFVQIPWDGRDRDGNEVANGVYFYRVIAKSDEQSTSSEVLGKLTVLR